MRSLRFEPGTVARHASDLAGHCQRCPDGFYRGNCDGGGSSSESTDVENTNNGDTDNQNSDETEGDGTGDDTLRAAPLPDDTGAESVAQPADDSANGEGAIALAAENKSTYTIRSGAELSEKLPAKGLRDATGSATFELVADIKYNGEIKFEQTDNNPINITLNLNGHKIKCLNTDKPLFDVAGGATLTIKDEIKDSAPVLRRSATASC